MAVKLMRANEFGKTGWGGIGSGTGYQEQYNFDQNINDPAIQIVESRALIVLVGQEMYDEMISVRNALDADYTNGNAIVKMFPNNANYEAFWQDFGLSFCYFAMLSHIMEYSGLSYTNSGAIMLEGDGYKPADLKVQNELKNTNDKNFNQLKEQAEKYLCKNKALYPKLRADICGKTACCNLSTPTASAQSESFSKQKPYNKYGFHI